MKKVISVLFLLFFVSVVAADTSDYIWNQQFAKKSAKAETGDLRAQYDVGNMYLKGQGTVQDAKQAFKWFKKAASNNYSRAQYKLGYLYHRGEGVRRNNDKAFIWVNKSAKQGYKPAMYYLGKLYAAGNGVTSDLQQAIKWHKKAYSAGYNPAKREIERLEAKLVLAEREQQRSAQVAKVVVRKAILRPKAKVLKSKKVKQQPVRRQWTKQALQDLIISNQWQLQGKPAILLPSSIMQCKSKASNLVCESKEMEYNESYGVISYTMRITYSDFSNKGGFTGEYNKYITLIFPDDPDDPDLVIPLDYGVQKKEFMRCRAGNNIITCYQGDQRNKVTYNRI